MHTQSAFTLFEMCLVITIIAILAMISLPSFKLILSHMEEEIEKAEVLRMITLAQREALAKHLPMMICKSKTLYQCDGGWRDGELVMSANHQIIDSIASRGHSLHWQSYPRYRTYIMFMPSGLLASDNSTFWYCADGETKPAFAIFLSKAGRTRLQYPNPDGVIKDSKQRVLMC